MRKIVVALTVLGMIIAIFTVIGTAGEGTHQFIGVSKCKTCHKSEAKGNQFAKWSDSKHAKAYEVLASDAAIAIGKEKGIDNPQTSDQCLSCHVTAFSAPAELKAASYDQADGVGCESCHGAGADYKKLKIMKDQDAAIAAGMVIPTEETCKGCHNENSPNFKEFNFDEAAAVIAHPNPKKK